MNCIASRRYRPVELPVIVYDAFTNRLIDRLFIIVNLSRKMAQTSSVCPDSNFKLINKAEQSGSPVDDAAERSCPKNAATKALSSGNERQDLDSEHDSPMDDLAQIEIEDDSGLENLHGAEAIGEVFKPRFDTYTNQICGRMRQRQLYESQARARQQPRTCVM